MSNLSPWNYIIALKNLLKWVKHDSIKIKITILSYEGEDKYCYIYFLEVV